MTISLKIFITKDENSQKIIPLDEPIILNTHASNCHDSLAGKLFVKSVSIFLEL